MNIIGITGLLGSGKSTVAGILVEKHGFVEIAFGDHVKRIARQIYSFSYEQLWGPSEKRNAPDLRYPREHGPIHTSIVEHQYEGHCACCGTRMKRAAWNRNEWTSADSDSHCYLTPRFVLQQLGTEFGRMCYPDTWVSIVMNTARDVFKGSVSYDPIDGSVPADPAVHKAPKGIVISDVRFPNEIQAIKQAGGRVWQNRRASVDATSAIAQHSSETALKNVPLSSYAAFIHNDSSLEQLEQAVEKALQG